MNTQVPAKLAPIASYYLFHNGSSVSAVLAEANLVNITQVLGQANTSRDDVINKLKAQFTIKYKVCHACGLQCAMLVC